MRHAISGNRLGRNQTLRKATIRDLAKATLIEQRICTTKAKAKEARKLVDRLITLGKRGTLAAKRRAFAIVSDHRIVSDLFNKIAGRFTNRPGGYTRIIPLGNRRGDNARMVLLELTEKDRNIVTQARTDAQAVGRRIEVKAEASEEKPTKKRSAGSKSPTAKINTEAVEDAVISSEPKKERTPKVHPKEEKSLPEKPKKSPKIMGGIKKIFKRPSSGGA